MVYSLSCSTEFGKKKLVSYLFYAFYYSGLAAPTERKHTHTHKKIIEPDCTYLSLLFTGFPFHNC